MKRILTILLVALLLFVSCGQAAEVPVAAPAAEATAADEETQTVTEMEIFPDLPDGLDFGGKAFNILCNEYPVPGWTQFDIDAEELNGSPVNDSVFTRNSLIEEKYKLHRE